MRTLKYIPQYTVSDYRLWEGNWELIDGIAHAMSPSPVFKHQRLSSILMRQIGNEMESNETTCDGCEVISDVDWIINDTTVLRPDIAIVCDVATDFITHPPVLIIEILSPSTSIKDRQVKFEIYQEQGVKYYIIANPATRSCQSYALSGASYEETEISTIHIHEGCTISIDLIKAMAAMKD